MDRPRRKDRWRPTSTSASILALGSVILPAAAVAQTESPLPPPYADSTHAVAAACAVVLGLRPRRQGRRCVVEGYKETATAYVVRVREDVEPGEASLDFNRSEVRLSKTERSVVVTREPDL
jgi:hypothetical protein